MTPQTKELLRGLPSVSALLEHEEVRGWLTGLPRSAVVRALQAAVDAARDAILSGQLEEPPDAERILALAEHEVTQASLPSLRAVINATGVVLHTGLGRAPLSAAAVEAIADAAAGYCNLEYDLQTGKRGRRTDHVTTLLASITGAEAATVVNNNAAATLMILRTLAADREVIVSRGQLVEIGGSFRLPEIMSASGATLREVGTTNRTRIADYERAINDRTAMLMRVHPSNYRVVGFCESASLDDIVRLAHRFSLLAVDDLGSGALFDLAGHGLPDEPDVRRSVAVGADLVCFSGDKLLGGPQCGLIVGKRTLVDRLDADPLMRTYRVDKLTLAALEATLHAYVDPEYALETVPTLAMLRASTDELAARAQQLCYALQDALPDEHFFAGSDVGYAGGGSMPGKELATVVVQWRPARASADAMVTALRSAEVPVIARIREDAVCFDIRTVRSADMEQLVASVSEAVLDFDDDGPAAV